MSKSSYALELSATVFNFQTLFKVSAALKCVSGSVPPQVVGYTSEQGHSSSIQQSSFLGDLQSLGRLCWKTSWSCI